jgi:cyclopropane fatty-acyl-phospholipid synthase-like methyltransferase
MRKTRSLDAPYFESLYRADPDPWKFETSPYEAEKYAKTLATIRAEPVRRALEMGCSIGVFTQSLAAVCDRLVATELSENALAQARRRCAGMTNIDFILAKRMTDGFDGAFDLMLLSEVVYYWDDHDLAEVATAIEDHLQIGGRLVLVHWLGETDYPRSADDAVSALFRLIGPVVVVASEARTADYRMDVWRRIEAQPTAASSGD